MISVKRSLQDSTLSVFPFGAYVASMRDMDHFHVSSGRRNYSKSIAWYVEEIESLDEESLSLITSSFVIRWNSKQYGTISPDFDFE